MTNETNEIERLRKENEALRRKKKKAEQEAAELALMAYMSGNMGSVYRMEAAAQASGAD